MCCFFIPTAEAAVLTLTSAALSKSRNRKVQVLRKHLNGLSKLLFGGSLLLALEHIWHGEITFHFPYITAMQTPEDTEVMIEELWQVGVPMAVLVTLTYLAYAGLKSFFTSETADRLSDGRAAN